MPFEASLPLFFIEGFLTGLGLLVAIGPQGAFVLRQGLLKKYVFIVPLFCSLSDVLLVGLGIGGFGKILTENRMLFYIAKWGGVLFLFYYGFCSFRLFFSSKRLLIKMSKARTTESLKKTLLVLFALTFFNPLVYLDTVVLLGTLGARFEGEKRWLFAIGAMSSAFVWFFSLSYGARLLSPLFQSPKCQKMIEGIVGCIMWTVAVSVLRS